jgi:hypothetical protein
LSKDLLASVGGHDPVPWESEWNEGRGGASSFALFLGWDIHVLTGLLVLRLWALGFMATFRVSIPLPVLSTRLKYRNNLLVLLLVDTDGISILPRHMAQF